MTHETPEHVELSIAQARGPLAEHAASAPATVPGTAPAAASIPASLDDLGERDGARARGSGLGEPDGAAAAKDRTTFLLAMYKAMWDNINRHILVVWQSMTALLAALGASYLSGKDLIDKDLAPSFVVLAAAWSVAHSIDARAWFNRNLLIIRNIERQFLDPERDESEIHFLFAAAPHGSMIDHLQIQVVLAVVVAALVLASHFFARVAPTLDVDAALDPRRAAPYLLTVGLGAALWRFHRRGVRQLRNLALRSPGRRLPSSPDA